MVDPADLPRVLLNAARLLNDGAIVVFLAAIPMSLPEALRLASADPLGTGQITDPLRAPAFQAHLAGLLANLEG